MADFWFMQMRLALLLLSTEWFIADYWQGYHKHCRRVRTHRVLIVISVAACAGLTMVSLALAATGHGGRSQAWDLGIAGLNVGLIWFNLRHWPPLPKPHPLVPAEARHGP